MLSLSLLAFEGAGAAAGAASAPSSGGFDAVLFRGGMVAQKVELRECHGCVQIILDEWILGCGVAVAVGDVENAVRACDTSIRPFATNWRWTLEIGESVVVVFPLAR